MRSTARIAGIALGSFLMAAGPSMAAELANNSPTFAKDVAPILQEKCQECHRPGQIAPMSLIGYRKRPAMGESHPAEGCTAHACRPGLSIRPSESSILKTTIR